MSFDPTGYTSPMSICILISPALKTTWTAALISMRSFARDERPDDPGRA